MDSVEASLKRLDVDYIELLQVHWPDRYTSWTFGRPEFLPFKCEDEEELVPLG